MGKRIKVQKDNTRIQVNFSPSEIRYLELLSLDFKGLTIANTNRLLINYLIDNGVDVSTLKDYIKISTVRSNYGNYRINQLDKFEHVEDIFKKQNNHNSRVLANLNGEVKTIFDYLTKELDNGDWSFEQ